MAIMSKLTASYLAGLIDGEGYIGIEKRTYKRENRIYYQPIMKMASTNKEIIDWLKNSFGGNIWERKAKDNENYKDSYQWSIKGEKMDRILEKIIPYLRIKKEQAVIARIYYRLQREKFRLIPYVNIEFLHQKEFYPKAKKRFEEIKSKEKELREKIKQLNHRGKKEPCTVRD